MGTEAQQLQDHIDITTSLRSSREYVKSFFIYMHVIVHHQSNFLPTARINLILFAVCNFYHMQCAKFYSWSLEEKCFTKVIKLICSAITACTFNYLPYNKRCAFFTHSVWNWENGEKMNYFHNQNPKNSRITSMDFLNSHDVTLVMTGSGE